MPVCGSAKKEPFSGGPLVVTITEDEERPHDKVNIREELSGSILPLITKFSVESLPARILKTNGDAAAWLRLNEVLLATVHVDVQVFLVITSPVNTNLF